MRKVRPLWQDDKQGKLWPRGHHQLAQHTEELKWTHIISGSRVPQATEEFSRLARNAGATSTPFESLDAMIAALAERTYGTVVVLADTSIIGSSANLKKLSDARGNRKLSVPILLTRHEWKDVIPQNTHKLWGSPDAIINFKGTLLGILSQK